MIIRIADAPAIDGARALLLCDDGGEPLPMQQATILRQQIGEMSTITVTFLVDGDAIRFEAGE
ncbi:hypothetical protein [uncultured Sphingomonas sp.]|uniref:hypothetical protein n=1 Tax=uncultured Sphingomonas sp. TaxID=158754 RepID=UPI002602CBC7|nr:hypothetical protein [uncultured Sphingomonas sp.]